MAREKAARAMFEAERAIEQAAISETTWIFGRAEMKNPRRPPGA